MNLNELRNRAYKTACEHGFHDTELSNEHWLCLVISELMEAVEADRKRKRADVVRFNTLLSKDSYLSDLKCYGYDTLQNAEKYKSYEQWHSERFQEEFKEYIKDTVEDELADAAIRLLDLYGLRKIELDESAFNDDTIQVYSETYQSKSFTESVYYIAGQLAAGRYSINESAVLPEMLLLEILGFAKHLNIDLPWHIDQKMKYNQSREKMHGKKY